MSMRAILKDNGTLKGTKDPSDCKHPEEHIRGYGGPHGRLRICDYCGSRWKENKETKQWDAMEPKKSSTKLNLAKAPETKIVSKITPAPTSHSSRGAASKPAGPPPMPSSAPGHMPTEIPLSAEAQFHYAQFLMAQVMAQAPPSHDWLTEEVEPDTLDQSDM